MSRASLWVFPADSPPALPSSPLAPGTRPNPHCEHRQQRGQREGCGQDVQQGVGAVGCDDAIAVQKTIEAQREVGRFVPGELVECAGREGAAGAGADPAPDSASLASHWTKPSPIVYTMTAAAAAMPALQRSRSLAQSGRRPGATTDISFTTTTMAQSGTANMAPYISRTNMLQPPFGRSPTPSTTWSSCARRRAVPVGSLAPLAAPADPHVQPKRAVAAGARRTTGQPSDGIRAQPKSRSPR